PHALLHAFPTRRSSDLNNTAEGYGGAIYTNSATAPYLIDISVDDSYSQNGGVLVDENNSAAGYGDGPSTAAGGFMYLGLSEVTLDRKRTRLKSRYVSIL